MKSKFKFVPTSISLQSLKLHPWLEKLDSPQADRLFMEFIREFNYYERPVVTEEGYVLTHTADFLAAKQNRLKNLEVVIIKGASDMDLIKFICFKDIFNNGRNRQALHEFSNLLTDYLTTVPDGQEFAKKFKDKKTREIVAKILGVATGTLGQNSAIARANPELLAKIDSGEVTNQEAYSSVQDAIRGNIKRVQTGFRSTNLDDAIVPMAMTIKQITMEIEGAGMITLNLNKSGVKAAINTKPLNTISLSPEFGVGPNRREKEEPHTEHVYTFQPEDDSFSIQIAIRDLSKLKTHLKNAA